ncbi:MAG: DNA methyltransferase, partial [Oscillospiraceae bacterium]
MASAVMKKFSDAQALKIVQSENGSILKKATKEEMIATAHDERYIVKENEYILIYGKNKNNVKLNRKKIVDEKYNLEDELINERGKYILNKLDRRMTSSHYTESLNYPILTPDNTYIWAGGDIERSNLGWNWRWGQEKLKWGLKNGYIVFKKNSERWSVYSKQYEKVDNVGNLIERDLPYRNIFLSSDFSNTQASSEIINFFNFKIFEYAKSSKILKEFINIANLKPNDIILDFFSGSATTAHAVMQLNAEDGGNRKFIMVQLPEETDESSEAFKDGYKNICEIGKERIRRAGEKIKAEIETANAQLKLDEEPKQVPDIGFKVFRTADTNIKWNIYNELGQIDTETMAHTPDLADFTYGFNDIDVVYEVMLRQKDVPLSATLETLTDIGSRTYLYGSTYLVCLETEITETLIDKLAALDPLPIKFIFRDSAFKDDINLKDETFRRLKNLIERNSGLTKKTYTVEFI